MSISRVHYRERQRLTAADLRAEQEYRVGLAGRHHLTHHEWGAVRGLHVRKVDGHYLLMPGVAIDGYGRELLVTEPIDLNVDGVPQCLFVTLYYCEYPEDATPGRTCHDAPAPRITARAKVVTGVLVSPPPDPAGPADARAAGAAAGMPPWPVVVDAIGTGPPCRLDRDTAVHAVQHRGSVVRSPSAKARIKLGLERRSDVYHFLVFTTGASALEPRVGIDRDGVTHVWKPLIIWGPKQTGAIAVTASRIIKIEVPFGGRPLQRLQMTGIYDSATLQLSGSVRWLSGASLGPQPVLPIAHARRLSSRPRFLEAGPRLATIRLIPGPRDRAFRAAEAPPTVFDDVMRAGGGLLMMKRPERAPVEKASSCETITRERAFEGADTTTAVEFRPAASIADTPSAREVYAVTTSAPDAPFAETTLRLSGGAEDKTDVSTRLSIGRSPNSGTTDWVPSLRMDGGRRLGILAAKAADPALDVEGTLYLPPIGKDDPHLPDMMTMAFMAGLRQVGRVAGQTFDAAVAVTSGGSITRGGTLKYSLTLKHPASAVLRRAVEFTTGVQGTSDLTFRSLPDADAKFTNDPPDVTQVSIENFTHSARRILLQVVLLVVESNVPRLVISNAAPVDIT